MRELAHPELSDLVEDDALAGDRRWHDDIKCRDPIGGDDQHVLVIDVVDIAHFTAVQ